MDDGLFNPALLKEGVSESPTSSDLIEVNNLNIQYLQLSHCCSSHLVVTCAVLVVN